jgi:hypothetical protein
MTGGVCSATSSVKECFFIDIDVKGGERSRVRKISGTESSLVGRMQRSVESECVAINVKVGDCWKILNKQRMRVDGCCH